MLKMPPIAKPKTPAAPRKQVRAGMRPPVRPAGDPRSSAELPAFPHALDIGRLLGRAFKANAVLDPGGCARAGAQAFTAAGRTHFSSPDPPLDVAAHEAAHVLQQKGETRDMGLGAEGHASAVERHLAAGRNAEALLGDRGASVGTGPHHYTEVDVSAQSAKEWNAKVPLRVSEDGYMATQDTASGSHDFWAHPQWIATSNATLAVANSGIRLDEQASKISGSAPNGNGYRTLSKILPKNLLNKTAGDSMALPTDCASAARTVMGVHKPEDAFNVHGIYKIDSKSADPNAKPTTKTVPTAEFNVEDMMVEILMKKFALKHPRSALEQYWMMPTPDREKFNKETGLNKYVMPSTGEGYAIASGGMKIEGAGGWWPYHWAGVVMTSGSDRVTLENFAVQNVPQNSDWVFQMYGSIKKVGQTFHEQHAGTGMHGTNPMTITVRHTK